jgi:hypothetical protein
LADAFVSRTAVAFDQLEADTDSPEVRKWARSTKLGQALGAYSNASGPNALVNLLDMVVLITLRRMMIEQREIPQLLHDEGLPVLEAFRRREEDAWLLAARALTPAQLDELHQMIDHWWQENGGQMYVAFVRFQDFAEYRR